MGWAIQRHNTEGKPRWIANYRDPSGRQRSAGTYPTRKAAETAAAKAEGKVEAGT